MQLGFEGLKPYRLPTILFSSKPREVRISNVGSFRRADNNVDHFAKKLKPSIERKHGCIIVKSNTDSLRSFLLVFIDGCNDESKPSDKGYNLIGRFFTANICASIG